MLLKQDYGNGKTNKVVICAYKYMFDMKGWELDLAIISEISTTKTK